MAAILPVPSTFPLSLADASDLPVLRYDSPDSDIVLHLQQCQKHLRESGLDGLVSLTSEKLLGFKNGQERAQEIDHEGKPIEEMQSREIFSTWRQAKMEGRTVKAALAATYVSSWVRENRRSKDVYEQHAWVVLVVTHKDAEARTQPGKTIVFWDPNWQARREQAAQPSIDLRLRRKTPFLLSRQSDLVQEYTRQGNAALRGVWIAGEGNDGSEEIGRCLDLSIAWLTKFCQGKSGLNGFAEDELQQHGFTRLGA